MILTKIVSWFKTLQGLIQQLDSARSDCQFLSAQHAETLKGLHAEIDSLQRSNRELQFKLTFESDSERVKQLEASVEALQLDNVKYQSQLDQEVKFPFFDKK